MTVLSYSRVIESIIFEELFFLLLINLVCSCYFCLIMTKGSLRLLKVKGDRLRDYEAVVGFL
jgi:hypothetical protein